MNFALVKKKSPLKRTEGFLQRLLNQNNHIKISGATGNFALVKGPDYIGIKKKVATKKS
ncbi:hypothetical protein J7L68_10090 [bacterium]|nr:hypothetical protein [bacterium]